MPPERPSKTAKIHAFARAKSSPHGCQSRRATGTSLPEGHPAPPSSSIFNATPSHERSAAPTYPGDAAITKRGLFVTIATSNRFRDLNRNLRGSNSLQETETGFGFIWIF